MRRLILLFLAATASWAGPFEAVALDQPVYRDLRLLHDRGLDHRSTVTLAPGQTLTRFQCAHLWATAYRDLTARIAAAPADLAGPADPAVEAVAAAMLRVLNTFGEDIAAQGVVPAEARAMLRSLPQRLASLAPPASARQDAAPTGAAAGARPPRDLAAWTSPAAGAIGRESSLTGPGLGLPALESGALSLSLDTTPVVRHDGLGPSGLVAGHVLAADLRLELGDSSVILEYAQSLAEREGRTLPGGVDGEALKAGFLSRLGSELSLDVGYRRMSAGFFGPRALFPGEGLPAVAGIEAGLAWQGRRFGVESLAGWYRPEGEREGYLNQLSTQLSYAPGDHVQLSLGYQVSSRRRLAHLEDAWRGYLNARVVYDLGSQMRAGLSYQFERDDRGGSQERSDHAIGASLGLGF